MELLKLRRRTQVAKRGHKLLKDKLDELMKHFLARIHQSRNLRRQMEEKLAHAYQLFAIARAEAPEIVIEESLMMTCAEAVIELGKKSAVNITIPELRLSQKGSYDCYSLSSTPAILDEGLRRLNELLPLMIELAEMERAIELLSEEIEKTRRRVNALEYILIPQLDATVSFVTMKLDEMERSNLTRLMKIKSMVAEA
jgi:V/A-type H+-transporting ATPase subunit D